MLRVMNRANARGLDCVRTPYGQERRHKTRALAEEGKNPQWISLRGAWTNEDCSTRRPLISASRSTDSTARSPRQSSCDFRKLIQRINRRSFANRNASATVNALDRAYKKLGRFSKLGFILARMNAVHRTNVHALLIFRTIACYYISHNTRLLRPITIGGPEPRSE